MREELREEAMLDVIVYDDQGRRLSLVLVQAYSCPLVLRGEKVPAGGVLEKSSLEALGLASTSMVRLVVKTSVPDLEAIDLNDPTERLILADWMDDQGRDAEAHVLRHAGDDTWAGGPIALRVEDGQVVWDDLEFEDYADAIEYVNQREYGDGQLEGEWWYSDDRTWTVYVGSFGNYNSPGASHYTDADRYDTQAAYDAAVASWEAAPGYVEDDEPDEDDEPQEPEEDDYITDDMVHFYQQRRLVVTVEDGQDWREEVRHRMDAGQFWPNVWYQDDHGGLELLSVDQG